MSKSSETTPILIKNHNKDYIVANITYLKNNSIIFSFPSKRERIINKSNLKKHSNSLYSEQLRILNDFNNLSTEPKVTFHAPNIIHPNSMIVHVNSNIVGKISSDFNLLNVGKANEIFIYLMQIIIPSNLTFFDEYINNHSKFIEIDNDKIKNKTLSIEFIIHSTNINMNKYCLPFSKNRNIHNIVSFITNNDVTCSIIISTLKDSKSNLNNFLLLSINTDESNLLYSIINKEGE